MSVLVFDIQNQFVVTRPTRKGDNSASYQMSTPTCSHVCSFEGCEKTFSRRDRLLIHLRTHTGEVRLKNCHIIYVVYIFNMKQARPWMLANLKIIWIWQFHAHPVHQQVSRILGRDISGRRLFLGPNLVSFNRTVVPYEISEVNFRVETKILVSMSEEI